MDALALAWQRHRLWSEAASLLKSSIQKWRVATLVLSIAGAALETLASQLDGTPARGLAVAGAVHLAIVPIILVRKVSREQLEQWIRARSASEGLKKAIYQYLMEVPPFDAKRDEALTTVLQDINDRTADITSITALVQPAEKPLPQVSDADSYLKLRVTDQIEGFYTRRARDLAKKERTFRGVEFFLALTAAGLSAAQAISGDAITGAWVAVLTTAGTALTAHVAAERYQHLVVGYLATAARLEALSARWSVSQKTSADRAQLVADAEEAISIENQGWMASWIPAAKAHRATPP